MSKNMNFPAWNDEWPDNIKIAYLAENAKIQSNIEVAKIHANIELAKLQANTEVARIQANTEMERLRSKNVRIAQQESNRRTEKAVALIVNSFLVKPISTASQHDRHQTEFKATLISEYRCQSTSSSPSSTNFIRCMVTGEFIRQDKVKASHLIPLKDEAILSILGFTPSFKWSPKTGLLLFDSIDKAFKNMTITFLLNHLTSLVTIQVLYDDMLDKQVFSDTDFTYFESYEGLTKSAKKAFRKDHQVTFGDLNGRNLLLPTLVFPSTRVLTWVAQSAYKYALADARSHECATRSHPTPEAWSALIKHVNSSSSEFTLMNLMYSQSGELASDDSC